MESVADPSIDLIERARALAPRISAAAGDIERESRLPASLVEALCEAGLLKMLVPRSLGGSEATLATFSRVCEEVAKADASTAWCVSQNGGICRMAGYMPRAGAEAVFGPADMRVAWGNGPAKVTKVDGGYKVTGRWAFGSGMHHARFLGCHDGPYVDEAGQPILDAEGHAVVKTLFFPREDVEVNEVWSVSGLRGTGSDGYTLTDYFVPEHRCAFDEPVEQGPLYLFGTTNIFSVGFASVSLGIGRATLDALLELAITKTPRGLSGPLREMTTAQVHVAQSEALLRSARALLHQTVDWAWERVSETREFDVETRVHMRMATTYAIQSAATVVDTAYKLAGATAIFTNNAFERRFRDMHAATQHLQAREDHFEPVGQFFFGLDPSRQWL